MAASPVRVRGATKSGRKFAKCQLYLWIHKIVDFFFFFLLLQALMTLALK